MALEDTVVLDLIKSMVRIETKLDMLCAEKESEYEEKESEMPAPNPMTYSNALELDFPPFILES